jgi:hypothetical protein
MGRGGGAISFVSQLAADLLQIDGLALICESRVAADYEEAADARQAGGQARGHAVDEIVLFGIAAHIGEGKDHDGEGRRPRVSGAEGAGAALSEPSLSA